MKTYYFTLTLLLTSAASFAQTAFTKATLDGILKDYQKNPHDFFKRACPPDFRYIAPDGSFKFLPELLKGSVNDKVSANEIQEQKIIQSGDVAVVSGTHVVDRIAVDGTKTTTRIPCTYTFQRQGGTGSASQWKFVASQHTAIVQNQPDQTTADEVAIKAVAEGHSQASEERDAEKAIGYLAKSPNVAVSYNVPGYPRGYEQVADGYRKVLADLPKGTSKVTTSDYRYRIVGNTAFVTYIEIYTKPDGTVAGRNHKANYLEKEGGQWKMIGNFWMPEQK